MSQLPATQAARRAFAPRTTAASLHPKAPVFLRAVQEKGPLEDLKVTYVPRDKGEEYYVKKQNKQNRNQGCAEAEACSDIEIGSDSALPDPSQDEDSCSETSEESYEEVAM